MIGRRYLIVSNSIIFHCKYSKDKINYTKYNDKFSNLSNYCINAHSSCTLSVQVGTTDIVVADLQNECCGTPENCGPQFKNR